MNLLKSSRRLAVAAGALALLATAQPSVAQEISDSHLAAARSAIGALRATDQFDQILPAAAQALKNELIQRNPDLQSQIIAIVDQAAFSLAARRGDLEREAALAHARVFSEEELAAITAFYQSDAGKKLISDGPIVLREVFRAAEIWQVGVTRDMAQRVAEEMRSRGLTIFEEGEETPEQE